MGSHEKRKVGVLELSNGAALAALDDDDMPTGVGVRMLAKAVSAQQAQVDQLSKDVAEIKTSVKTALAIGRGLLGLVPIVAAAVSAATWAVMHLAAK
jgi:hypothetical protein